MTLLSMNLDDVKLAHEIAVLEVLTLSQLLKALANQCMNSHDHNHHQLFHQDQDEHLLDDVLGPLRAPNARLDHLVQLGRHEHSLHNASHSHPKGCPDYICDNDHQNDLKRY